MTQFRGTQNFSKKMRNFRFFWVFSGPCFHQLISLNFREANVQELIHINFISVAYLILTFARFSRPSNLPNRCFDNNSLAQTIAQKQTQAIWISNSRDWNNSHGTIIHQTVLLINLTTRIHKTTAWLVSLLFTTLLVSCVCDRNLLSSKISEIITDISTGWQIWRQPE